MCRIANKNRVRFSKRLQTSGKIHGIAKNCNACICTILHLPNYRRPGVEPDAQLWAHAMTVFRPIAGVATAIAAGLATNLFGAPRSKAVEPPLEDAKTPAAGNEQCEHACSRNAL